MYKMLIVDDEAIECEALKRTVEEAYGERFAVQTAPNAKIAIAMAESIRADIVLMDIEMPGMSGLEAAGSIKRILPRSRIVIITAYQRFQYAQSALAIGVEDYLLKPIANRALFRAIDKAMEDVDKDRNNDERQGMLDQLAKEQFVLSAVSGYSNATSLKRQLQELNIPQTFGFFCVAKCVEHISAEQMHGFLRPEMARDRDRHYLCYEYDERLLIAALMDSSIYNLPDIRHATEKSVANVREKRGVQLLIGIGNIVTDLDTLQGSYELANEALSFCTEANPVQYLTQSPSSDSQRRGLEHRLYQFLLERDIDAAAACVDIMLDTFAYCHRQPEEVARKACGVLSRVARMLQKDTRVSHDISSGLEALKHDALSRQEISIRIRGLLVCWIQELDLQPAARVSRNRAEIERYIQAHYAEDLSIKQVALAMHYSEPYFSKLFSRCFHRNFVTYLTEIRTQTARDMLVSTRASIKDIGVSVGYADSNYFAKVFRRAYGVSPSDYRQLVFMKEEESKPEGSL